MFVNVGPFRYKVVLVHGHIDHEGEDCLGLCDNIRQKILISDIPPERQRLQVFFHELMHAWWYHFDVNPADQEAVVDLVGIAMTDFVLQALKKLDREELERALMPTRNLTADQPARSDTAPKTARPTPSATTAASPEAEPEQPIHCTTTIEQSGWRMRLYEPAPSNKPHRAAG